MKRIIVLLLITVMAFTLSGCGNKEYTNISNDELVEMLENPEDYQFVDVRTLLEYDEEYIPGFDIQINLYNLELDYSLLDQLDKDKPVVIMCNSGNRSVTAAMIFHDEGFTEIYNLTDGIQGWINEGLETE